MRGLFPANLRDCQGLGPTTCFLGMQSKQALPHTDPADGAIACTRSRSRILRGIQRCLISLEGESLWTSGCAGRLVGLGRTTGAAPWLGGTAMPSADEVRGRRERDKLTIAEVCADLGISRRTFYEWRAKGKAPRCITLPNGSLRIRRSEYQRWLAAREEAA
jgi:excisionase family DNA binding protein